MVTVLRRLLLVLVVGPVARLLFGLTVINRHHVPTEGPAIIAANHNSHVDTMVLLCLFPSRLIGRVRPVAAADHFLRDPVSSWFSRKVVGIIPLRRHGLGRDDEGARQDVLAEAKAALARGDILIVFPEGTRGAPETMGTFKAGIARLAEAEPRAPVIPIYIQGAGRALPRDSRIPVPFNVTVVAGPPVQRHENRRDFTDAVRDGVEALKAQAPPLHWD